MFPLDYTFERQLQLEGKSGWEEGWSEGWDESWIKTHGDSAESLDKGKKLKLIHQVKRRLKDSQWSIVIAADLGIDLRLVNRISNIINNHVARYTEEQIYELLTQEEAWQYLTDNSSDNK